MRSEWSGKNGRNGGSFGSNAQNSPSRNSGDSGRGAGSSSRDGRWSNELDAIFERAPKQAITPAKDAPNKDDERNFFDERTEVKPHTLQCPNCSQSADYALTWLVRRKRDHPAGGYADDATRARFDKARSYMVRRDDQVACTNVRCRKRFEIAGVQTVAFLQEAAVGAVDERAARVRAAFAGRKTE